MSERTYYETLDVAPAATQEEIRESYRILASVWHPDRFSPNSKQHAAATEKLKEINAAYEVLKDRRRREEYDRTVAAKARTERGGPTPSSRFSPEQERQIEYNRRRYAQALESPALRKFSDALGIEEARRTALTKLDGYQVALAKDILRRFNLAMRG